MGNILQLELGLPVKVGKVALFVAWVKYSWLDLQP